MKQKIITLCSLILLIPFIASAQFEQLPDMELGYTGAPVIELQKFLNTNNYIVNSIEGEPGSIGYEGTYFGKLTQKALSLFQKDHTITPSLGYFGPKTRAKINEVIQGAEQGELSSSLLAGKQTYTVNYYTRGIPSNPAGCNNKSYNPTIVGSSNTIGPFSYPVKMTFTGSVDDNLMINGTIVDRNMELRGGSCSHKHNLTYSQNFPANTPIRFNVIDNYGVETSLVGTVTIEPTTPPVSNVKLNTTNINGKITQPNSNGTYQKGDRIEIKAEPNKGYVFEKWTGACSGTKQTCTILMDGNKNVTAVFKAVLKLTFEVKGPGSIKAAVTSNYGEKEKEYIFDKTKTLEIKSDYVEVKLLAVANENSRVVKWTDDICKRVADPNAKQLFCDGHKEKPTSLATYLGDSNVTFGVEFAKAEEDKGGGKCAESDHVFFPNINALEKKLVQFANNKGDAKLGIKAFGEVAAHTIVYKDGSVCAQFVGGVLSNVSVEFKTIETFFQKYKDKDIREIIFYHTHDKKTVEGGNFVYKENDADISPIPSSSDLFGSYERKQKGYHNFFKSAKFIERVVSPNGIIYQYDVPINNLTNKNLKSKKIFKDFLDKQFQPDFENFLIKKFPLKPLENFTKEEIESVNTEILRLYQKKLGVKFSSYRVQ